MALSDDPRVAEAAIANPNTPDWAKRRAQRNAMTETVGSEPTDGVEVGSMIRMGVSQAPTMTLCT